MSLAHLFFQLGNVLVLPAWVMLLFFPGNAHLNKLIKATTWLLAAAYISLLFGGMGDFDSNSFSSLQGLRTLFASDEALAAGWLHYLCFDLLVGYYIVTKGREQALARWKYTLPLPFTFLFGPMGWLLFALFNAKRSSR